MPTPYADVGLFAGSIPNYRASAARPTTVNRAAFPLSNLEGHLLIGTRLSQNHITNQDMHGEEPFTPGAAAVDIID